MQGNFHLFKAWTSWAIHLKKQRSVFVSEILKCILFLWLGCTHKCWHWWCFLEQLSITTTRSVQRSKERIILQSDQREILDMYILWPECKTFGVWLGFDEKKLLFMSWCLVLCYKIHLVLFIFSWCLIYRALY